MRARGRYVLVTGCMRFRPLLAFASALLCPAFVFAAPPPAAPGWAHDASDLKPDAAIVWGRLDNGLRYAIRPNAEPKDRVSLRLLVLAGSFHETEAERGLAHFLEHMAFNGTTHFPPGQLVEYFQRLGLEFGADTNASTGFERTLYKLELPKHDPASIEEGFRALRDYADGMLLGPDEIERERGIILSEKRDRDSVEFRAMMAEYEFVLGSTLVPRRLPIGEDAVIRGATRQQFLDFYRSWYRPERMAVVVVGQIKPADVAPLIAAAFGSLRAPGTPPRAEPELGHVATTETVVAKLHHDPELSRTSIALQTVTPCEREPDTAATRVRDLPRGIACAIVNRRLSELAKKDGAPFTGASTNVGEMFDLVRNATIDVTASKPELWREALAVIEQELRRALEFGFQPAELREIVANELNNLDESVKQAATRRSPGLAEEIAEAIGDERVVTDAVADRDLFRPALEKITVEDCLRALREAWSAPGRLIFVSGNLPLANPQEEIADAYAKSAAVKLQATARIEESAWAYTDFGAPGAIAARREVADLGITEVEFANGVKLNLKKTDFQAAEIHLSVRLGGGMLTLPADKPGLNLFFNAAARAMGLGRHSIDDLRRILAGRSVGAGFSAANDSFVLSGSTKPDDLELELQLLAAFATDPGFRPEAERLIRRGLAQHFQRLTHVPDGPVQLELSRLLASGDHRFGLPSEETIARYTMDDLRAWITPALRDSAIEIGVVGEIDPERTIALVAKTFGALPRRTAKPAYAAERKVGVPARGFEERRTVQTEIPRGLLLLFWPTADAWDAPRARRLGVLAAIFEDRLRVKVREGLGGAYSPGAGNSSSDTFTGYGYLSARVDVDPAMTDAILSAVREIAESLRTGGVTEDELARAKQPILTSLDESIRTNGYWLGAVLSAAQEQPIRLDWSRTRRTDTESISKADIDALAAGYLRREREIVFVVLPEKPAVPPIVEDRLPAAPPAPASK